MKILYVSALFFFSVIFFGLFAIIPAGAQTVAELQAQINSLMAQISQLQGGNTAPQAICTFTRNLTIGSRGSDVTCLQNYLTTTGYFTYAGGATGFFGPVTRSAVSAWQAANGITPAVGYFGPISRQTIGVQMSAGTATETSVDESPAFSPTQATPTGSLNTSTSSLQTITPVSATLPSSQTSEGFFQSLDSETTAAPGMRVNQVMLFRAFPYEVRPGDTITLDGSGFSKIVNEIYFNGGNRVTASSTDGITMEVSVPSTLSVGEYSLSVSNVLGSSEKSEYGLSLASIPALAGVLESVENPDIKILLKVTNNPEPAPIIESASIEGDMVTLVGKGFTSSNNLFTTLGETSSPISSYSNGTTLTFRVTDLSLYDKISSFTKGEYQTLLWIYVHNEHGISKEPFEFNIRI